jgi:hypothetical protein
VERATRLRRYLRKDYSQIVEFPVEIVGRDGLVRRYSFDDSVRLYQRRVHSAPLRYDDGDLIDAEIRHCRQRIEQLRRSYLEHFGWGELREGQLGGLYAGPLAAEVAAFLRRAFAAERDGPLSLRLTVMDSGTGDVCYVRCVDTGRSWVLYAWRLDADAPSGARDAWRSALARLASAPVAEGVERLLFASDGPDLALILGGTGEWAGPTWSYAETVDPASAPTDPPDPLHAGVRALYDGKPADALRSFELGMEAQPARAALAQAAAVVALVEGESERAEFAARFGRLSRPGDALLGYVLGLALLRQGRAADAEALVVELDGVDTRRSLADLLGGVVALRGGRLLDAWSRFTGAGRAGGHPFAVRVATGARGALAMAGSGAVAAGGTAGVAVALLNAGEAAASLGVAAVAIAIAAASGRPLWTLRRAAAGAGPAAVRLATLELLPREREADDQN